MNNSVSYSVRYNRPIAKLADLRTYASFKEAYAIFRAQEKFAAGKSPIAGMQLSQSMDAISRKATTALLDDWHSYGTHFLAVLGNPNAPLDRRTLFGIFRSTRPKVKDFNEFITSKVRLFLAEVEVALSNEGRVDASVNAYLTQQIMRAEIEMQAASSIIPDGSFNQQISTYAN